jgi:tripartite-type tricarboxylate transporter receptor subunit TctC
VPTFKELGFELASGAYRGIAVPKSTPEALRKQISDMIDGINQDPEFRKRLENDGMAMLDVGYDEMDAFMAKMKETYHGVAKEAGIVE